MRTAWKVAEIDYRKKAFDYDAYVRANTPSYAEIQEQQNKNLLRRMQNTATIGEIWAGQAQNVLLKDFGKNLAKQVAVPPIPLSEDILKRINVSGKGSNLGLLRNGES